jgi:hypothetical protein
MNAVITVLGKLKARCALRKYEKTLSPRQREYARSLRYWLASSPDTADEILVKEKRRLSEEQHRLVERVDRASQDDLQYVEDRLKVVQDAQAKRA